MNFDITVGQDCEAAIFDKVAGRIVSAIPVLKKGKENKIDLGNGYYFYFDNCNLEMNIPPANSREEFVHNNLEVVKKMKQHLGSRYDISFVASHNYTNKECNHNHAKRAGCMPEFLARPFPQQITPPDLSDTTLRTMAGHIHCWLKDYKDKDENHFLLDPYSKIKAVKSMDIFVGLATVILDQAEESRVRKQQYGVISAHRPTEGGIEYRTPSNFWMKSVALMELMYDLTKFSMDFAAEDKEDNLDINEDQLIETVNRNDFDGAKYLAEEIFPKEYLNRVKSLI